MFDRSCLKALLSIGIVLTFVGCTNTPGLDSIQVTPATQSVVAGQTTQLTATGTYGNASHPSTQNITTLVSWTSNTPAVATVNSSGVVTGVSAGTATITATAAGFAGTVSATSLITVTAVGGGSSGGSIVSLTVIPGSQSVATPNQSTQFIAIGTTSLGTTVNLGGVVAWYSSDTQVASINQAGLALGANQGTTTITAIATNPDNTVAAGTATLTVISGATEQITSLTITPSAETLSAEGQTSQLIAIGTSGTTGLQENLTSSPQLTWGSSISSVATISNTGLVKGQSVGSTTISALWTNPDNTVVSAPTATITTTSTPAPEPLLSLTIIPSSITVGNLQDTGNFLAIGTFSTAPNVRDLTNSVTWLSSAPDVFPVDTNSNPPNPGAPAGIVTAYGNGTAVIIAEATDPTTGSIQTATATFNCPLVEPNPAANPPVPGTCYPGSQASGLKVTLTIYNEGLNTTNWLVTAPSATGTQNVIHCGPGWMNDETGGVPNTGGSVCTGVYPLGTTLTITAPAQTGVAFGGWSWDCKPVLAVNATGPNSCTVYLGELDPTTGFYSSNVTVGAIFNNN